MKQEKDNHNSLDEYEFWPKYEVSCSRASEKSMYDVVTTVSPSFLIGSLSLQAVTAIIFRMVMKFCKIRLRTVE